MNTLAIIGASVVIGFLLGITVKIKLYTRALTEAAESKAEWVEMALVHLRENLALKHNLSKKKGPGRPKGTKNKLGSKKPGPKRIRNNG